MTRRIEIRNPGSDAPTFVRRFLRGIAALAIVVAVGSVRAQGDEDLLTTGEATTQEAGRPIVGKEAAPVTFEAYGMLLDRNIFDRERRAPTPNAPQRPVEAAPQSVVEHLDLLGTWIAAERSVAFIDGNRRALNNEVVVGASFGNWTVERIDTAGVVLSREERRIEWPVGQRLERVDEGDWNLAGRSTLSGATSSRNNGQGGQGRRTNRRTGRNGGGGNSGGNGGGGFGGFGGFGGGNGGGDFGDWAAWLGGGGGQGRNTGGGGESDSSDESDGNAESNAGTSESSGDSGVSADDLLKRMMERRQREAGQ